MNLFAKLKTVYTGHRPNISEQSVPMDPPKRNQPDARRLALNERARAAGQHIAIQRGRPILCEIGANSASHYSIFADLDELEAALNAKP